MSGVVAGIALGPALPSTAPVIGLRGTGDLSHPDTPGTRQIGSPITLDIPGNGAFWFRDVDRVGESSCTYNKEALSIHGSGPKTIVLNPMQTACWYIVDTMGQTIPAGDWETLLDVSVISAEYSVTFQIWNADSHTVAGSPIGSCNSQSISGGDIQCLIPSVPAQALTSNQIVRIVIAFSTGLGTVSITYDDAASTSDSRATLPIPEFGDIAIPVLAVVVVSVLARRRRRQV